MTWPRILLLVASCVVAGCEVLPLPEPPDTRTQVGGWVALGRGEAAPAPELADFVAVRTIAVRALAERAGLRLTEPVDDALVSGLLRIDDLGGAPVFGAVGPGDPVDAWLLAFRAPAPDSGPPTDALVVVAAATGEVLLVHLESRELPSVEPGPATRGFGERGLA